MPETITITISSKNIRMIIDSLSGRFQLLKDLNLPEYSYLYMSLKESIEELEYQLALAEIRGSDNGII